MRERINRLARGMIDSGVPELALSFQRLETAVPAGEVIRGELLVGSANNLHIKGLVYSSHERVQVIGNAFGGLRNRIIYEVNSRYTEHGDMIKGSFYLVTNAGEREIPYSLCVQTGNTGDVYGTLSTPRDFGLLAKRDLEAALRMFEYQDFTDAPFMKDARVRTIYEGLKGRAGRRNLLEEFLVALHVKEPVRLTLDTDKRVYENPEAPVEAGFELTASGWGYVSVDMEADAPFIELPVRKLTDRDFAGGRCLAPYRLVPEALHRGLNFGRIKIRSLGEEFAIEIEVRAGRRGDMADRGRKERETDRESLFRYLCLRLDYEEGKEGRDRLLGRLTRQAEHLRGNFPEDERTRLLQAELLVLGGKLENASLVLDEAEDGVMANQDKEVEAYCFYQYLRLLVKPDQDRRDALARSIKKRLWEEGEVRPWLFLLLEKLDETMAQNPLKLYESMTSLFEHGCSSPFLYGAAGRLMEKHPDLLAHLGDFEVQVLHKGVQRGTVSARTALRAGELALGVRHYRRLVERLLMKLYEAFPGVRLLEAVCSTLIRGECKSRAAFAWYEKALDQGVNLTRLYEYFLYSLPGDYSHLLPKEVLLYFSYDKDLDSHSRSILYRNILLYMNPGSALYETYARYMEQFAMEELFRSRIDSRMAVIYDHMIYRDMIDVPVARVLPGILKACRIRCEDPRMKYVIVRYEELEEEEAYLLEEQAAYVPVFSDRNVLLFQDAYGSRYLDVKHWKVPVMDKPELLDQCYKMYPAHPMLRLRECRSILEQGVATDRQAGLLEEAMMHMRLSPVFEASILEAVTGYYCRRAAGEGEGPGGFNCTYLIQLDKKRLGARQRQQICGTLISQNYLREAYDMIREYGGQYIEPGLVMKLCSKTILMRLFDQDDLLLHLAYQVFREGVYDSVIMDYLCEHFNGACAQMYEVLIQGSKEHVETYDLEERLLCQMLFTGCCQQIDSVFELYMKRKTPREMIVKAYFTQKSVQYFLEGIDMDSRVFEYLKNAVAGTLHKDKTPTVYLLALTRYFAAMDRLSEEDRTLCRTMTSVLLEEGLVFPYTRELSKHIPIPEDIMDKAMVEYRGKKDGRPELMVRILPEEADWHSEDLKRVYQGIYVKQKVLFQGEAMEYRIYDQEGQMRILAAEGRLECDRKLEGKENSRFACLNQMGSALKDRDSAALSRVMEEYMKKSAALGRLFPIE